MLRGGVGGMEHKGEEWVGELMVVIREDVFFLIRGVFY